MGRAPPNADPGASRTRRPAQSSSAPESTRRAASSSRGNSETGGIRDPPNGARNTDPDPDPDADPDPDPGPSRNRTAPCRVPSSLRSRKSASVSARGVSPASAARRASSRRSNSRPQRSGAASEKTPKTRCSGPVWNAPGRRSSPGSSAKRPGWRSQSSS